jgi:hypothetical protein
MFAGFVVGKVTLALVDFRVRGISHASVNSTMIHAHLSVVGVM